MSATNIELYKLCERVFAPEPEVHNLMSMKIVAQENEKGDWSFEKIYSN